MKEGIMRSAAAWNGIEPVSSNDVGLAANLIFGDCDHYCRYTFRILSTCIRFLGNAPNWNVSHWVSHPLYLVRWQGRWLVR